MILEARNIKKVFKQGGQEVDALRGVTLTMERGEFVSIMGPSGSGKSTLLHLIGGLDRPSSGTIHLDGQAIHSLSDGEISAFRRRRLGFIFQFFNLLPTLNAIENVALPLLLDGKSLKSVAPKARDLLIRMGMSHRLEHRPDQLSGGEMQRVAIARALISDPILILADEPTGNLDTATGTAVLELLSEMVKEKGHTVLMVTHDLRAASFGHRIFTLLDGREV